MGAYEFRSVVAGVQTLPSGFAMQRHHHDAGYATVLLAGSVTEVSFAGRMRGGPGDVFLHGRFDCHLDRPQSRGALQILRLPWSDDALEGLFHVPDPDSLVRLAEHNPQLAAAQLRQQLRPCAPRPADWVDQLAAELTADSTLPLQRWAEKHGLRLYSLSRGFQREFGVSPKRFRLEARTRLAWREIVGSQRPLTEIAHRAGFSDLAHLSRSIRAFTGRCPRGWRRTALPEVPRNSVQASD